MTHDDKHEIKKRGFSAIDLRAIQEAMVQIEQRTAASAKNKRREPRYAPVMHPECRAYIEHMGGSTAERMVYLTDIGAMGIGLVHHGYIHPGAEMRIELKTSDDESVFVTGTVRWCVYLKNKLHLLGVAFEERINPRYFMEESVWMNQCDESEESTWSRERKALFLSDDPIEASAMQMLLKNANIQCDNSNQIGAALDQIERVQYDIVITNDELGEEKYDSVIHKIISKLYSGPIVVATFTKSKIEDSALAAGASHVVEKPIQLNPFLAALRDIFEDEDDPVNGSASILTTLTTEQCPDESLEAYITATASIAKTLGECISTDNFELAVKACTSLHATGAGYGFETLTSVANAAIKSLHASGSVQEAKADVRKVIKTIGRLRGRDPQKHAA